MIDVLALLCLPGAPETCVERTVPVGAANCAAAEAAARPRIEAWRRDYEVGAVRCGPMSAPPLNFEEVGPGLFVHVGDVALADPDNGGDIGNIAFVIGDEAVAVIDAGGSRALGEGVVAAIRARTDRPIRALVLTHYHPDHVFGGTALIDAGAEVLAHARLPEALAVRAESYLDQGRRQIGGPFLGSGIPEVDRTIDGSEVLDLGGRLIELQAWPVSHSVADVTVVDRSTGTIIAGDLVVDRHLPTLDGSLGGWLTVLDDMGGGGVTQIVPGHGGPLLPWPDGVAPVRRYLDTLARDLRALLAEGAGISEAAARAGQGEKDAWDLFDVHNARNATMAYTELEWE
ncbi:quinoprotein relay system zinc metallohydrolase 2 [Rubellimicrobium arenae]|uniref:quinoprotein relay system zinc metallohydrolase 2 n=1 Tax=Rubellimicrobium arenae TaxID=2817372 RepID=UPI001B307076|nr:quinoprotein relay system zinc metallohydrolase 2 [Rubellimicrobium arenae]